MEADVLVRQQRGDGTPGGRQIGKAVGGEPASRGRYLGDARWYSEPAKRGDALVVTTRPVLRSGPEHPRVRMLVESTLARLADPVLGVPPIPIESFNDKAFRERR